MEETKIIESQRKTKLKSEEIRLLEQSFVIVPYQTSGFLNYTNQGVNNNVINPEDFETFKRVWTGNDACIIQWKDSISYYQDENGEPKVQYQLGEVFLGALETCDDLNEITTDQSFSDYKSQQTRKRIQFYVNASLFTLTDYYQFMFFKIPEYSGSILYRMTALERDYIGNELVAYVITLETVNQDLANTGRARQQNIMPNSPGQGYLECVVKNKNWPTEIGEEEFAKLVEGVDYYPFYNRYITTDFNKRKNNPVRKMIVKVMGAGILSSISCVGRPVLLGDDFTIFRPQRLLFPYNFTTPTTPTLYRVQNNANNFYAGRFTVSLDYYKDFLAVIKDLFNAVGEWKYQGFLKCDYNALKDTNPITNNVYKYELYGWLDTTTSPVKFNSWKFNLSSSNYSTSGVPGCDVQYTTGGEKEIWNHMFDAYWTQKAMKSLPINENSTMSFGLTLASLLGLSLTSAWYLAGPLFTIGLELSLIGKIVPKFYKYFGIVSAPLIDLNIQQFNNNTIGNITLGNDDKLLMNMFDNNSEVPSSVFFNSNTLMTGIEGTLTDRIQSERVDSSKQLSTINIGQTQFEDGSYILSTQLPFLMNGDTTLLPTYDEVSGYIIDRVQIQCIGKCDISIEFKDLEDNVVWTGIYQSEGKWTDSLTEIWTDINTSVYNRETVFFNTPLSYPRTLPDPVVDFAVGERTIITIDERIRLSYQVNGGAQVFSNGKYVPGGVGGGWITYNKLPSGKREFVIKENITREELISVYDNVSFYWLTVEHPEWGFDTTPIERSYNVNTTTLFDAKNLVGNDYIYKFDDVIGAEAHGYKYAKRAGAILFWFDYWEAYCYIRYNIRNIQLKWSNNTLSLSYELLEEDQITENDNYTSYNSGIVIESHPINGSIINYTGFTRNLEAGPTKIVLYPK